MVANTFLYLFGIEFIFSCFIMYYHKKGLFFKSDYVPIEGSREEKLIKCFKPHTI